MLYSCRGPRVCHQKLRNLPLFPLFPSLHCLLPPNFSPLSYIDSKMSDPPITSHSTERTPLLTRLPSKSRSTSTHSTSPPSPPTTPTASTSLSSHLKSTTEPEEPDAKSVWKKFGKFGLIWGTIGVVVIVCIVQSVRKGNGEFDWKDALKKAGGGVSFKKRLARSFRIIRNGG